MLTKHLLILVCICASLLTFSPSISEAQEPFEAPLLINISGQMYRWLPGEEAPTPAGCDLQGNALHMRFYSLNQSADGIWASFMVLPADMEDGAPTPTGNLWVCNLEVGAAYALSDADPSYPGLVSHGVFSPDGRYIAWAEVNDPSSWADARILVHDLATQETSILVDNTPFDEPCGVGVGAPHLVWGDAGIAVGYFIASQTDCSLADESGIFVYNLDDSLRAQYEIEHNGLGLLEWIEVEGEPHLVYQDAYSNPLIYSINIQNGSITEHDSFIDAYLPNANNQAGHYILTSRSNSLNPPLKYLPASDTPLEGRIDVALSPDGSLMVLVIGKSLYLGQNGNLEPALWNAEFLQISGSNSAVIPQSYRSGQLEIAWTQPAYRLVSSNTATSVCPSAGKLFLRESARVLEGLGDNNLRIAPWPNATILGNIPEGEQFALVDTKIFNPSANLGLEVCSNNIRWREVLYNNLHGWTAESQDDGYFIEAVD